METETLEILKKRISSYRTPKGKLTRLPDELLIDVLYKLRIPPALRAGGILNYYHSD